MPGTIPFIILVPIKIGYADIRADIFKIVCFMRNFRLLLQYKLAYLQWKYIENYQLQWFDSSYMLKEFIAAEVLLSSSSEYFEFQKDMYRKYNYLPWTKHIGWLI